MKRTSAHVIGPVLAGLATLVAFTGIAGAYQSSSPGPATTTTTAPGTTTMTGAISPDTVAPGSLVQLSPCGGSPNQGQTADSPQPGGGTHVTFSIAPSTVARVNPDGSIIAVATNTGCAPQAWNVFYVQAPDGAYRPATASQVDLLLNAAYSGDWTTPNVFHPFG